MKFIFLRSGIWRNTKTTLITHRVVDDLRLQRELRTIKERVLYVTPLCPECPPKMKITDRWIFPYYVLHYSSGCYIKVSWLVWCKLCHTRWFLVFHDMMPNRYANFLLLWCSYYLCCALIRFWKIFLPTWPYLEQHDY